MINICKNLMKSIRGNSLAEFAVTTALMATLAATAAPKLSKISEATKAEKTYEHIDKLIKQAGNFYQKTAETEGRGRFPGQDRFYQSIGGPNNMSVHYYNDDFSSPGLENARQNSMNHHQAILKDLGLMDIDGWRGSEYHQAENHWIWVFNDISIDNNDDLEERYYEVRHRHHESVGENQNGRADEWLSLFGDEILRSPYQFGDYAYTVVAGGGSGDDVYPPVIYIVDVENAVHFNNTLTP
tara:strand:+ start:331 stop:1053 length:723 start_codon:yes stop_codon:yes gene_type:complete